MSFLELKNMWDVNTPLGFGKAMLLESLDHDYLWTVVLVDTGAIVTFPQSKIKMCRAYTLGINFPDSDMRKIVGATDG